MTTVPSSLASSRAACALALMIAIVGGAGVSGHRLDEYLQAARLAIGPDRVEIELDLTPGLALADAIVRDIDRNRDGHLSQDEQHAYGRLVLSALDLEADGRPLAVQLSASDFPDVGAIRRGEGTIRLQTAAALPRLSMGAHALSFRNRHDPNRSVYLANALVPQSDQVEVTAQRRDGDQRDLTIDYVVRAAPATSQVPWLLGTIAVAVALSARLMRPARSVGKAVRWPWRASV
jgi:hypothetical protein